MRRLGALACALLVVLGLDLMTTSSVAATLTGLAIAIVALFACVRLLLLSKKPGGEVPAWRRRTVQAFEIVLATVVLFALIAAFIRLGPTKRFIAEHTSPEGAIVQKSDPELGWAPQGEGVVGMRLEHVDPNREHILVLGDSIIYGLNVPPDKVGVHLLGEKYAKYQVLNGAVSGYSVDQYYLILQRYLPKLHPKVVVVTLFSGNDWQVTMKEYSWGHSKPLFEVKDGQLVRADHAGTCIDNLAQSLLFRLIWGSQDVAHALINTFCKPRELTPEEGERTIRMLLAEMDRLIRASGAEPVFMVSPQLADYDPGAGTFYEYLSYHHEFRRVLHEGGYRTLELYPPLKEADKLYQQDKAHYTEAGQAWLAETLYQYLQREFSLEKPGDTTALPASPTPPAP